MKRLTPSLGICLAAAFASLAQAQTVTPKFTYQGQLKQNGSPMNGTVNVTFTLWTDVSVGSQVGAADVHNGVTVTNGLFTVEVNDGNEFGTAPFNGTTRWLQVNVNGTNLTPRQPLDAAPYASYSMAPWQTNGTDINFTGGSVGIGTTTPSNRLTVSNPADNSSIMAIDSGLTAAQYSTLRLNDRGTPS